MLAPLQAVLQASGKLPESSHPVRGWDFDHGRDLDGIMAAMLHSGLQASALGEAVVEVNRMVSRKCCCWHWQCFGPRVALWKGQGVRHCLCGLFKLATHQGLPLASCL